MRRVSKSSMTVAVATLLMGMLAGVVWARPNDAPEGADITRMVTITPPAFVAQADDFGWRMSNNKIYCDQVFCIWYAPVEFPCLPSVTVERIKMHIYQYGTFGNVCASLLRLQPARKRVMKLGEVCSKPDTPTSDPRTFTSEDIDQVVWPSQGAIIRLEANFDIDVYGVTVEYHRNI